MTKREILAMIAKELREFANAAHGNPPTVLMTRKTLLEYAEAIEKASRGQRQ